MAARTLYPSLEEALHLHRQLLQRFGGTSGVRDLGLLESALARPRSGYYRSLSEQAAALLQSLALNHSFTDGNKRMAFALTATFLLMNGRALRTSAEEGERFLIDEVIVAKVDLEVITGWVEGRVQR